MAKSTTFCVPYQMDFRNWTRLRTPIDNLRRERLIKEFDCELKGEETRNSEVNKQLIEKKQSMIKELSTYVATGKKYTTSLGNKRVELFDMGAGGRDPVGEENVQMASAMSNQELINAGMKTMDETDQAIERSKMVVEQTIEVGTQTAVTVNLKGQVSKFGHIHLCYQCFGAVHAA
ncbi:SNARE fusion complex domain-containing protein [Dioscorea alata]|uniref:SNARE fusion complex domain-containing protein n=2 Tax=Dioscorea alata TaxID=55571 RepID=A0ACB7VPR6_DIOAL|nr:SNARE fusion complex domain-containing protein [Dioscorea alata]KAH7676313.1 SNARE fusion complex domain-containing protein [Dioscorea alata]